jgi:L-lactate dehydrogenase complex protein LldF
VKIPIPDLLVRLRQESVDGDKLHPARVRGHGAKRNTVEAMIWKGWGLMHSRPGFYRFGTGIAAKFRKLQPGSLGGWTQYRTAPKLAPKTLHQRMKERQQ